MERVSGSRKLEHADVCVCPRTGDTHNNSMLNLFEYSSRQKAAVCKCGCAEGIHRVEFCLYVCGRVSVCVSVQEQQGECVKLFLC